MAERKYYEMYRRAGIGSTLTDALDALITENRIEPQLAIKVLLNFDRAVAEVLAEKVRARMTMRGHLHIYNTVDDVHTFQTQNVKVKLENGDTMTLERMKIVALPQTH